uniref:Uncharacterized protein n=1 Tax=Photinus pyralis TaxID=7054 RepID=A0A1Y1L0H6_PHOPY
MGNRSNQKQPKEETVDKATLRNGELPTRIFEERDSVLTDLMGNKHILTIYHIFIALHLGIAINSIAHDYILKNEIRLGFDMVYTGFKGFHVFVVFWLCAFVLSLLPYYCVQYWNRIRIQLKSNGKYHWPLTSN